MTPLTLKTLTDEDVRAFLDEVTARIRATKTSESTYDAYFQLTSMRYHCLVSLAEKRANRGGSRAKSRQKVCDAINDARRKAAIMALHCFQCYDVVRNAPKQNPCTCQCHR